jgi:hypothetical protein
MQTDISIAAAIVDQKDDPYTYLSKKGVKFRLSPVPSVLIEEAARRIKLPSPPIWINPDKEREEENPNDPTYVAQVQEAQFERGLVALNLYMSGTEVEHVPPDVEQPEGERWFYRVKNVAGIDIPEQGFGRYLAWVKFYVLQDEELVEIRNRIMRISGRTMEVDVQQATDTFRSNEERDTNNGASTSENG